LRDLNHIYMNTPALHQLDFFTEGFNWIDCHDAEQSVISYLRRAKDGSFRVIVLNFTPIPRMAYRIGVPFGSSYRELFNSDSVYYGGSNIGNGGALSTTGEPWLEFADSLIITLPPLAGVIFAPGEA
jgi:1,4-alpha-glucan branching enzyme